MGPIPLLYLFFPIETGNLFRSIAMAASVVPGPLEKIRPEVQRFLAKYPADGQKGMDRHDINVVKRLFEENATVWSAMGRLPQEQQQELYNMAAILWVRARSL